MQALLKQLDLRQFQLLLAGIGTVLMAMAIVFAVVPPVNQYRTAAKTVAVLEEVSREGGELEVLLGQHGDGIEELKRKLHGDMANLPPKQVESYIIGKLQRISWGNDIELVSVAPAPGEKVQIFQETLFRVRLSGRYGDLYRWLSEARSELGFVVVKEFGLQRQDRADDDPLLLADLSLASYRAER